MKKKTNTPPNNSRQLTIIGAILLFTTPIIQPIFLAIAQLGCPIVDGKRDCEFEQGLQIAVFADALPWVWLIASAIIIIVGTARKRSSKNKS